MDKPRWCEPFNTCKDDSWNQVSKNIGSLLLALHRFSPNIIKGAMGRECFEFFYRIKDTLIAEGWEIKWETDLETNKTKIIVKPPKDR